MKESSKIILILILALIVGGGLVAVADFSPPTHMPPEGNVAPPLNTGNVTQVKTGAIGIQKSSSALTIPEGVSLYTDAAIGVKHDAYTASNSDWAMNSGTYALDTNAPISVYGLFSTGPIRSESSIVAPKLTISSLKSEGVEAGSNKQLCANTLDGSLVPCTDAVGSNLQVSISVSPTSVMPNVSTPVTVSWQATSSATSCTALQGQGFSTSGEIWGKDKANSVVLADTETAEYVVVCSDSYGNNKFASAQVVGAQKAPILSLSINPSVGGWTNGAFFTTGLSIDPNGGGTVNCRKKVEGSAVSSTNGWSGQKSGVWSSVISVPPSNSQSINTCFGGCQFKDIVTSANQSALLTIQCSNAGATTTESKWISVGQ